MPRLACVLRPLVSVCSVTGSAGLSTRSGGRNAISLSITLNIRYDRNPEELLRGVHSMDRHFKTASRSLASTAYERHDTKTRTVLLAKAITLNYDDLLSQFPLFQMNGLYENQEDPRNIVFGFGRRICPGRRFADIGIWQAMANIVATFDLGKARDAMGNEITPPGTFSSGLVNHPHKFKCTIRPRSKQAVELITNGKSTQT
ncbi:uncharacterized protein B0H18DRAFT_1119421 [Fomitopsis serialis]|uniref:uncharacterized protein n=1 Tax=Fomitopsis serialis TaxID=139415 RepID=UPI0020074AE4|nr:uncharacterized protein B0H18DRAFT_1119421 [Neoantrodia serialis]KAH9925583.1 hypothetical protein B0H18DRAFT_1119421 [Neoantrodia serialis]